MGDHAEQSAGERKGRPVHGAALLLLSSPLVLFAIPGMRSGFWTVAGAVAACALAWPFLGHLSARGSALLLSSGGYLGGGIAELLRPQRVRLPDPDAGQWLSWIVRATHPEALLFGCLYAGFGMTALAFLSRAPEPQGLPSRSTRGSAPIFLGVAVAAALVGHANAYGELVFASHASKRIIAASHWLAQLQVEHRARTGRFALSLEEVGLAGDAAWLETEMSEGAGGELEAELRHRYWWTLACHIRLPPTSDTARARVEELTERTCVDQSPRRPISALRGDHPRGTVTSP